MAIPISASYTADRAASLAGVPRSTLYYWARTGLVVPSVSVSRVKKWSFADLLVLRLVEWLRRDKPESEMRLPRTSMTTIRRELARVEQLGERLADEATTVWVDHSARLHFGRGSDTWVELGDNVSQEVIGSEVDLIRPVLWHGYNGPHLRQPRQTLRIIPGKLAGEPHVAGTRISTEMIAALDRRGFALNSIAELYPSVSLDAVRDAIDLERQLEANLSHGDQPAAVG